MLSRRHAVTGLLLSCLAGPLGCAHEVTVRSEPAGADVYLLDDFDEKATLIGPAPVTLEVSHGCVGAGATIVVADEDSAVQATIQRGRITPASFGNAALDAGLGALCCGGVAAGVGALTFWLLPLAPWLLWPGACVAGCAGVSAAVCQPLGCATGMWAAPDIVDVNLRTATASSLPGEMVGEVLRVEGPPPISPRQQDPEDEGGEGEPDDERRGPDAPVRPGTGVIEIRYAPPMRY